MKIEAVPESIPRARINEIVKSLGIDPSEVMSIDIRREGVYVDVVARDAVGRRRVDSDRERETGEGGYAKHRVLVPVLDEGAAR